MRRSFRASASLGALLCAASAYGAPLAVTGSPTQATLGQAYTYAFTASGGMAPYVFSGGPFPAGLAINANGTVSGTPTLAVQNFPATVAVKDATGAIASGVFLFRVGTAGPLAIATGTVPPATLGVSYTYSFTATGGTLPYSNWTLTGGAAPSGLTFSASVDGLSGILAGTADTPGSYPLNVQVTDGSGATATRSLTFVVSNLQITSGGTPVPDLSGSLYSPLPYGQSILAAGGTPPYTFSLVGGSLPPGLTLNGNGTFAGSSSTTGTYTFAVQATDSTGLFTQKNFSMQVFPPGAQFATTTLPNATVGAAYSQTIAVTAGRSPYVFAISGGTLPPGLTLSAAGAITGTPTASVANASFTVQVTDASGARTSSSFTLTVNPAVLTVTTALLPTAAIGATYSTTLAASGGVPPYTFGFVSTGGAPLSISTTGVITGTLSRAGSFLVTVAVVDSTNATAVKSFTLTASAAAPPVLTTAATLPAASTGQAYSQTLAVNGGLAPYNFRLTAGSLPAGLSLSAMGLISGTPTVVGQSSFSITVTDANGLSATQTFTLAVGSALSITTAAALPPGSVNAPYSQNLVAAGGISPYSFALVAGSLPSGLSLSSGGVLAGSPTLAGSYSFTVSVTDATVASSVKMLSLVVSPSPIVISTASTLPIATVGVPYSTPFVASGGTGTGLGFNASAASAPPGLAFDTRTLSGTPTTAGTFTFTLTFFDSGSTPVSKTFTLVVNPAGLAISTLSLSNGAVGAAYSQTLAATGGTAPYQFAVVAGALPAGVSLSAAGSLSGTPTQAGAYPFTVQVRDSAGAMAIQTFTLTVAATPLSLSGGSLPLGRLGAAYSQNIVATGGTPPYSYTAAAQAGLTLSASGTLAGMPTAPGTFAFNVQVADAAGSSASAVYIATIAPAGLTISTPSPLPLAGVGVPYAVMLAAVGGSVPVSFALTSGALPTGITLSTAGLLSGSATTAGIYTFTMQATDAGGLTASMAYSLTVGSGGLAIAPGPLAAATVGVGYSQTLTASGGTPPYQFSGTVPAGLSLSPSGVLSGTPPSAGVFAFTVQVMDAAGTTVSQSLSLTIVAGGPSLGPAVLPAAVLGGAYSQTLTVTGGTPPFLFSLASGLLPPGVSISDAGVLSGVPTQTGVFPFALQLQDSAGFSSTVAYRFQVASAVTLLVQTTSLPTAMAGGNYSASLSAAGGVPPYSWSGTVPPGLTLSAGGVLSGSPTTAGTYSFTVQVTDSIGIIAGQPLSLTVKGITAQASLVTAIVNAASYALGAVAPGEIVALFGSRLNGPAMRVLFDGVPALVLYVGDTQVDAIVPYGVDGKTATLLQVEVAGVRSAPINLAVTASAPGIFAGSVLNGVVVVGVTGEGQTSPAGVDGRIAGDVLPVPLLPVSVTVNGLPAELLYAGGAPGQVAGLMQVNARVPAGVSGVGKVVVQVGSAKSQEYSVFVP